MDALLLAAFAGQGSVRGRVLDLGCGCAVAGLGLALDHPDFFAFGLDVDSGILGHARRNIHQLGLGERFALLRANVCDPPLSPESMDLVLCNPPYRELGRGRLCADAFRNAARFESRASLADFVRTAAYFVRNQRACVFIHLAERVDELLEQCRAVCLQPKDVLFVHPRCDAVARLVLVRTFKNGGPGVRIHAPLILHEGRGMNTRLTRAAKVFCPRLACNEGASW